MEEEKKYCCNCKFIETRFNEDPCKSCYERSNWQSRNKFKTGDIVVSRNGNRERTKSIYIYLRNKWVLRIPYFVTVRSSYIISPDRHHITGDMVDKLIRMPESECEWIDDLEYASPEMIIEHDSTAQMVFDCLPFSEWFSELISEEPEKPEKKYFSLESEDFKRAAMIMSNMAKYDKFHTLNGNFVKNVIFSDPATIIFWEDGTKTVVKTQDGEKYDKEKGFAMAVCKKVFGNERDYYHVFKRWMRKGKEVK